MILEPDYLQGSEAAIKKAEGIASVVVYPKPNQLQLDVDSPEDLQMHLPLLNIIIRRYGALESILMTPSNQEGHYHVTIAFASHVLFDPQTRILLQACLGSDRKRELLGFMLHLNQDQHPTLFIEKVRENEKAGSVRE